MALELKQSIRMAQQLVVTPQLQQAIKLLQLSRLELATLIQKELLENPVLDDQDTEEEGEKQSAGEKHEQAKDDDRGHEHSTDEVGTADGKLNEPANFDWENYLDKYNSPGYASSSNRDSTSDEVPTYENVLTQSESLHDHLLWQIHLSNMKPREQEIGTEIIGNIDDDGYFKSNIEEIAAKKNAEPKEVEDVLKRLQEFDPIGVAARDISECLLLQLKPLGADGEIAAQIVKSYMPELERHDASHISKKLGLPVEKIKEAFLIISALEPKPGRPYSQELPQYIVPDVYVHKVGDDYLVTINEDGLPKLRVSDFYRRALMRGSAVAGQTKEYIQDRMRQAVWLIKSIHQRQRTLYRVATSIVKFQRDFFDKGIADLKPLVLRDVAEDISMHESTISRVTVNKFVHTPRGIFELKFFFNSGLHKLEGGGVASEVVKLMIKNLLDNEDPQNPLPDQDIAAFLKERNIDIARRTVAKYRETMGILPSSKRKKF